MTDTPRSLEDMLDLLADNNTNAIRAQTLRDLAVSIANPIPGDGFLGANLTDSMFAANCAASVTLVNGGASYGTTKVAPYGTNRPGGTELHRGRELLSDSYTLDGSDPTSAYGVDVDAGNAFLLEPGAWHAVSYLIISGGVTFSATIFPPALCYVDQVAWDPDFSGPYDGSVPWMWAGFYNPVFATTPMPFINGNSGKYTAVVADNFFINDSDEPQAYAAYMYTTPGQMSDVTLVGYGVQLWKAA